MIRKSFVQHSPFRNKRANRKSSTYTRWTPEEDELLRQAVALHGPHKWSLIASHVPNRTPMQCSTRWLGALNPNIHKGRWTEHEDAVLRYAYMEFAGIPDGEGGFQPIPWNRIAERIPNRTGIQCQARWTEALDPSVRKGKWSEAEDALLRAGVDKFGRCWIRIAETVPGRTQRQCRTRWMQIKSKEDKMQGKKSPSKRPACPTPMDDAAELSSCASTEPDSSLDFAAADSSLQQHNTFRLLDDLSMFDPQHQHHHPYQENKMATALDLLPTSGSGGATPTTADTTMGIHHDNNTPTLSTTSTAAAAAAAMTEDPSSLFASF
ncbi:hypothetical protein K492DRAFT_124319 [Lichtheimia hyalospora FSU 10163]|nr:hypothetical protein K492DRAFT_124319 [Lichtheimia hyalospora FSU 10163]